MAATATRRAALGALLAAAPAAVLTQPAALACLPVAGTEAEGFRRLVARWRHLWSTADAMNEAHFVPAESEFFAASKLWKEECARLPHYETTATYELMQGGFRTLSTESPFDVSLAKIFSEGLEAPDARIASDEFLILAKRREEQKQALRPRYNLDALERRFDEESERQAARWGEASDAFDAVMAYPVTSAALLAEKVALMKVDDYDGGDFWEDAVADIRRMAKAAA